MLLFILATCTLTITTATEEQTNDSSVININGADTNSTYQLQINTTGKWRLDITVDGNYTGIEEEGSKTINLGDSLSSASVTVNQYTNGPTKVYLLENNKTIEEKSSTGTGVETIYFYYQK